MTPGQGVQEIKAGHVRQIGIQEQHIRPKSLGRLDRLGARIHLPNDMQVIVGALTEFDQPCPHRGFIVDD
jgi:hypothetical protein